MNIFYKLFPIIFALFISNALANNIELIDMYKEAMKESINKGDYDKAEEIQKRISALNKESNGNMIIATNNNLRTIIEQETSKLGNDADLNHIDVSRVSDMSLLFKQLSFNGDISKWDVSNVKNMKGMFDKSNFNNDISNWDVANVENMKSMFAGSIFNGDISKWDVSNVKTMYATFSWAKLFLMVVFMFRFQCFVASN